jgi:hypothetical protein
MNRTLPESANTLGECFIKCDTRQKKKLSELYIGNIFFVKYFLSDTRQRLYRVLSGIRQRKIVVTTAVVKEKSPSRRLITATEPLPSIKKDTR